MKTTLFAALSVLWISAPLVRSATVEVDTARSRIQVDAKATGHTFAGNLEKYTIRVEGNPATSQPTELNLVWDFNDLKTADDKRDEAMIKWLGGGKPKGSFKFEKSWDETPEGGQAQGILTINGVSKSVAFPYKVKREGEWVTITGKASMDHQHFNLPIIRSMAVMTVDPKLVIRFHVVGKIK